MAKLTIKYQVPVPEILMNGEQVLKSEPIKLQTSIGEVSIYPPGSKDRKPKNYIPPEKGFPEGKLLGPESKLWNADTLWIDIETEATPEFPRKERRKLERETQELTFRFLRLLRRVIPEKPIPLPKSPKSLLISTAFQWETPQEGQLVYSGPTTPDTIIIVPPQAGLTKQKWKDLGKKLSSGVETELWEDFIVDAKVALDEDDLNRAIIYSAIACETFIKEYTEKSAIEKGISQTFWKYLKDPSTETRVLTYYDQVLHLVKGHSMKTENKNSYNKLVRIFRARNKIMHEGKIPPSWNRDKINQLNDDIREVEQIISWVSGL